MTTFFIPKNNLNITGRILKMSFLDKESKAFINKSLSIYLKIIKNKIDEHPYEWNTNKKFTNIYEFIHTNVNQFNTSISQLKPISRAFYKLVEIVNTFNLLQNYKNKNIKTFHLAEAPGGFIEAISYMRNNRDDIYYGTTLIDKKNKNIPIWKKSLIVSDHNIIIENCFDNKGDLYNPENFLYFNNKYYNQFDIVTADGGLDFSTDFENQENLAFKLILCEIFYAISILKKDGTFILKIFDIFNKPTVQCVYILSSFFKKVHIIKPKTSRSANSEKYVVCENLFIDDRIEIIEKFYRFLKVYNKIDNTRFFLDSFLDTPLQYFFINKIQELNSILGNKQIKNILTTLKLIENNEKKNEKITSFKNDNVQKCISWCIKNNIPYNKKYKPSNIFLNRKI